MDNNLKQHYKELAEKIESGEYFHEAREWYIRKYVFTFVERTYLIVLLLLCLFLGMLTHTYHSSIMPIKKSLPVEVNISSAADLSTRITYLGNKDKNFDVNDIFIKYFTARFVEAIESYDYRNDFKKLRINKNIIGTLGSPDILAYYLDKISIRNEDSLILKYRKKTTRVIDVDRTKIEIAPYNDTTNISEAYEDKEAKEKQDIKKYNATVNFTVTEIDKDGTKNKSNWVAKIILSFQTIKYNYDIKDFSPLNFKVVNYESKRID